MIWLALYLLATLLATKLRLRRPALALLVPWLVLDCLGNLVCGGSWRNTMSGEAWNHRTHPVFWWCHGLIDWLFGAGHCREQAERERLYGGVWRAWAAGWRAA